MKRQSNRCIAFTQRGERAQQRSQLLRVRNSRVVQSLHTVFLRCGLNAALAGPRGSCITESKAQARCRHSRKFGWASIGHAKSSTARALEREAGYSARHPFLVLVKPATGAPKSNERAHN